MTLEGLAAHMRRRHLVEIHEQDWCLRVVRNAETAYLQFTIAATKPYAAMVPILANPRSLKRNALTRWIPCSVGRG